MSHSSHTESSSNVTEDIEMRDMMTILPSMDRTLRAAKSPPSKAVVKGANVRVTKSRPSKAVARSSSAQISLEHHLDQSLVVNMTGLDLFKPEAAVSGENDRTIDIEAERAALQAISDKHKAVYEATVRYSELRVSSAQDLEAVDDEIERLQQGVDLTAWHGLGPGYASTLDEALADDGKLGALLAAMRVAHRRKTSQSAALMALKRKYDKKVANLGYPPTEMNYDIGDPELYSEEAVQAAWVLVGMKNREVDASSETATSRTQW